MCSVSASACISLSDFNIESDKSRAEFVLEFLQSKTNPCTELSCLNFYSWDIDIIKLDQIMSPCGLFRVPGETLSEPWGSFAWKNYINFSFPLNFDLNYEKVLYLSGWLKPRDSYYKTGRKMMQPSHSVTYRKKQGRHRVRNPCLERQQPHCCRIRHRLGAGCCLETSFQRRPQMEGKGVGNCPTGSVAVEPLWDSRTHTPGSLLTPRFSSPLFHRSALENPWVIGDLSTGCAELCALL